MVETTFVTIKNINIQKQNLNGTEIHCCCDKYDIILTIAVSEDIKGVY